MINYLVRLIFILSIFSFSCLRLPSQLKRHYDSLSSNTGIRYGKLGNGLVYYIKPLDSCKTLRLSLIVKAGNMQQDADQLDAAHLVEHLAFKPTENFSRSIMNQNLLDSMGMQIYDLEGSSGTYTEYVFNAPNNNKQTIDTAFRWFQDIAHGLIFSEKNVNEVRGEVRQEFLEKFNTNMEAMCANSKMDNALFPGGEDIENYLDSNKTFAPEVLKRFYKDWYRPQLMAISVIGNVKDANVIKNCIARRFSGLKSCKKVPEYKNFMTQYLARPSQFVKILRKTDSSSAFDPVKTLLIFRNPVLDNNDSVNGLKGEKICSIFARILNKRLEDLPQTYYNFYSITAGFYYKTPQLYNIPGMVININSDDNLEKIAVQKAIQMIAQLKHYGASKKEWENIMSDQRIPIENINYWCKQIVNNYIYKEPFLAGKDEKLKDWLVKMGRKTFNEKIKNIFSEVPEDIGIIAQKNSISIKYSKNRITNWINETKNKDTGSYNPLPEVVSLLPQADLSSLKEKKIISANEGKAGKEIVLQNGLKIILKTFIPSTGSKAIWIKGFSPQGAACFTKDDFYSAVNAPSIVRNSGFGNLNKFKIERFLSKSGIQMPMGYVDYNETVIQGKVDSLQELEILLQVIYLNFTAPRKDKLAFKDWQKEKYQEYFSPNNSDVIYNDFSSKIREMTGDPSVAGNGVFGIKYPQGSEAYHSVQKTELNKAFNFYRQLYGNAGDFTFLINGNFSKKSVLPLLQKYLGNLPSNNLSCCPLSTARFKPKNGSTYIKLSSGNRYTVRGAHYYLCFINNADPKDWKEQIKVYALGWLAYQEVMKLRFEKGYSIYGFGCAGDYNKNLSRYEVSIRLFGVKDQLESLQKDCKKIFSDIKAGKVENSTFSASTHRLYRIYGKDWAYTNRVMQEKLYDHYRYGLPYIDPQEVENYVKTLTLGDLVETAKKYCKNSNQIEMVMKN